MRDFIGYLVFVLGCSVIKAGIKKCNERPIA